MISKKIEIGPFEISFQYHDSFFFIPRDSGPLDGRRNLFMFLEDLAIYVPLPLHLDGDEEDPMYRIEGDREAVERAEQYLSSISGNHRGRQRGGAVGQHIQHIAERMAWRGTLYVHMRRGTDHRRVQRGFQECNGGSVLHLANRIVQFGVSRRGKQIALHIGIVRKNEVLTVSIPTSLGGVQSYKRMLRRLDRFDVIGPRFYMNDVGRAQAEWWPYQERYRRDTSAYRAHAARTWGWNGRDTSSTFATEYFTVHRHIRMLRACALVREEIMSSLRKHLATQGIDVQLITRHRGSQEIDDVLHKVHLGQISLSQAINLAQSAGH